MADQEVAAYNTILSVGDGQTPTEGFTPIARVKDFPPPGIANNDDDVSVYGQRFNKYLITTAQVEEFTVEIIVNQQNTGHEQLEDDAYTPILRNYKFGFADGSSWTVPLWVKKFQRKTPRESAMTADVTFRPSGAPTLTDAA